MEMTHVNWRKSHVSAEQDIFEEECVEVGDVGNGVAVRDSKDPAGPALSFTRQEWQALYPPRKVRGF